MKRRSKLLAARNARELAEILKLSPADAIEMDFRAKLSSKIAEVVKRRQLTHADVAAKARASRTRITAILNGNTAGISTDLLLRILYALGYKTKVTFLQNRLAA